MKKLPIFLILLLAIFLRFNNLNWDSNQHIHPDERFLTMVGNSLKIPQNTLDYFNPSKSTLNPANMGYKFFVYGTFPLTLNKLIAVGLGNDNYNDFTIQGRFLSALFDLLTIIVIYRIAQLLVKISNFKFQTSNLPLWSAFFYAIAVYPIQTSHFFTTDSFQVFFSLTSFYYILKFSQEKVLSIKYQVLSMSAVLFGLALASKISAIYILPLNLFFLFLGTKGINKKCLILTTIYLILVYLTLRVADPKFFTPGFIDSLKELKALSGRDAWYPPLVQWFSKTPVVFSLFNLIFVGIGLPYFIFIVIGIIKIIKNWRITHCGLRIFLIWMILFFLYQSSQLVQSIRYMYILFPFLSIFAAIGILSLKQKKSLILNTLYLILVSVCLIWPLLFSTIYFHKHTRVEASEWIYSKLESGSLILGEHWDDALPLSIPNNSGKTFQVESLPVFDPDTPEKWEKMNNLLEKADYYILSSNRGWGSIPTVPQRYPLMSKFYNDLFNGKTDYRKIKEFTSYPKFQILNFKFQINDSWSEETFTVYDHPSVIIFARQKK